MSRDVFEAILENLSPTDRFSLAKVDQKLFEVTRKWADVDSILLQNNKIILGNEKFKHTLKVEESKSFSGVLPDILELCPSVRRWYLEGTLTPLTVEWIAKYSKKIQKLYMSVENFNTRQPVVLSKLALSNCQAIYILQAKDHIQYNFNYRIPDNLIQNLFPATLRRVCLTGVFVSGRLLAHFAQLPKLASLDLMGSLVNTEDSKEFILQLEKNSSLEELSLAPSMFSFSTKSENKDIGYTFRNLHVAKLSIYMAYFDENCFEMQLKEWFSKELRTLVLCGNFRNALLKPSLLKQSFAILTESRHMVVQSRGIVQAECFLASHLIRGPPYVETEGNIVNPETWKFDFEAAKRSIETRNAANAEQQIRRAVRRRRHHAARGFGGVPFEPNDVDGLDLNAVILPIMHMGNGGNNRGPMAPGNQPRGQAPAAPDAAPRNPAGSDVSTDESSSIAITTSSGSYSTTSFTSNSSSSNESINRANYNFQP